MSINNGPGCGAVAVYAVCPSTEGGDVFRRDLGRAIKRELLVASASPVVFWQFHRDLAARDKANPRSSSTQFAQSFEQIIRGVCVLPTVASIINLHRESSLSSF